MKPTDTFDCDQVFSRLDDYLDRELSPEEMRMAEEHIRICEECALDERFERATLDSLKQKLPRLSLPTDLKARILERLANEPMS